MLAYKGRELLPRSRLCSRCRTASYDPDVTEPTIEQRADGARTTARRIPAPSSSIDFAWLFTLDGIFPTYFPTPGGALRRALSVWVALLKTAPICERRACIAACRRERF